MRFVIDECTGPAVAQWLVSIGYIAVLKKVLQSHLDKLENRFVTVTENKIRIG